jgi:hypothetical protein
MALANTSQAIGAVTRLVVDHLNRRTALSIAVGRPEDSAGASVPTLNVFLYETLFDPTLKNHPLAEGAAPPLWLTLKYLLTGFDGSGSSDSADAHDVLGQGLSALQELAFLGLDNTVAVPVRSALEDNPEPLKLTFDECNVDLVNKVTQASDDEYRLSIAFQVRPVMIVPPERPAFSLLVGVNSATTPISLSADPVGLDVLASLGPQLTAAEPVKFAIGDTFDLIGNDLNAAHLQCYLGSVELGITAQFPDRLTVRVETLLQSGAYLSAGEHPIVVKQQLPASGRSRASNIVVGRLLPTVTSAATGPVAVDLSGHVTVTVTLNGFLLGRNEDAILVGLYRDGAVAHLFDIVKPLTAPGDPPDNQQQLTLSIAPAARVSVGSYQVIVIVNGQQARQSPAVALVP